MLLERIQTRPDFIVLNVVAAAFKTELGTDHSLPKNCNSLGIVPVEIVPNSHLKQTVISSFNHYFMSSTPGIVDWFSAAWHWAFSGLMIALVLFLLNWMGRSFGVSSSFKGFCAVTGVGKRVSFFKMDLKEEYWRFAFVAGALVGGFLAARYFASPEPVAISEATISYLETVGVAYPESDQTLKGFMPTEVFNFSLKGLVLALIGGFLVGFGARYADGCTSGHAITGLAHFQLPSLLTVIGFFIGGLIMAHFLLPHLLNL